MMPKKSPVSHTILAHLKQHLHNKKGRPNREHRCEAGQIPSESQVRTSHNSRVLEMGKLCVPQFVRVWGLLQQQRVDLSSLDYKYFLYRSLLGRIWQNPFLIGIPLGILKHGEEEISLYTQSWVASNPVSRSSAYPPPSALTSSAFWECQPLGTPCGVPLPKPPFVKICQRKLTGLIVPVNSCLSLVTVSLCLIVSNLYFNYLEYLTKLVNFVKSINIPVTTKQKYKYKMN